MSWTMKHMFYRLSAIFSGFQRLELEFELFSKFDQFSSQFSNYDLRIRLAYGVVLNVSAVP